MMHVFVLVLLLGDPGRVVSQDMYFYSIERCNYFASQLAKRYGNYNYSYAIPKEHKATAYCKPVQLQKNSAKDITIYD